jgi:hypothetical protein
MSLLLEKKLEGEKPSITGTILFREAAHPLQRLPKGKKLMTVVGVVLVDESFPLEGETQARIAGFVSQQGDVEIATHSSMSVKLDSRYSAWSFDHLMCEPIWRA